MTITVAIKDDCIDSEPLIINQSITDLIESIENSIYDINPVYREYVRKIRNRLNLFESKETSDNVFFDVENINDDTIIETVTNILEISINLTLNDLIENGYDIKYIKSIENLIEYSTPSTDNLNYILDQSKQIVKHFKKTNEDKELNIELFYEILDASISNIVEGNSTINYSKYDNYDDRSILDFMVEDYYNYIANNLDTFVGENLETTKNNIKQYIINEARRGGRNRNNQNNQNNQNPNTGSFPGWLVGAIAGLGGLGLVSSLVQGMQSSHSKLKDQVEYYRDQIKAGEILPDAKEQLQKVIDDRDKAKELLGTFPIWMSWGLTFVTFIIFLLYLVYTQSITVQDFIIRFRLLRDIEKEVKYIKKTLPDKVGSSKVSSFLGKLEVDTKKCIQFSDARSAIDRNTICFENYINGILALLIYGSLNALKQDGVDLNKFRKFDDLYSYTGFASEKTRVYIQQLQDLHKYNVKYMEKSNNYNLVDYVDTIYMSIKDGIFKNIPFDGIWNRLPKVRK